MSQSPRETLPDEYLCEIGRVAVEWTKVEAAIEVIIWAFLFIDDWHHSSPWHAEQEGRAITTHINLLLRVDIMLSLARTCLAQAGSELEEIEAIAKRARELYPKRNKAVHGLWSPMGDMVFRQGYRARGDVSPFYDVLTLEDIRRVAAECIAFDDQIRTFQKTLNLSLLKQRLRPPLSDSESDARRIHNEGDKLRKPSHQRLASWAKRCLCRLDLLRG